MGKCDFLLISHISTNIQAQVKKKAAVGASFSIYYLFNGHISGLMILLETALFGENTFERLRAKTHLRPLPNTEFTALGGLGGLRRGIYEIHCRNVQIRRMTNFRYGSTWVIT